MMIEGGAQKNFFEKNVNYPKNNRTMGHGQEKKNFFKYTFVIHFWIALTKLIQNDLKTICSKCTV